MVSRKPSDVFSFDDRYLRWLTYSRYVRFWDTRTIGTEIGMGGAVSLSIPPAPQAMDVPEIKGRIDNLRASIAASAAASRTGMLLWRKRKAPDPHEAQGCLPRCIPAQTQEDGIHAVGRRVPCFLLATLLLLLPGICSFALALYVTLIPYSPLARDIIFALHPLIAGA